MSQTIFLSAGTDEFGALRNRLARFLQRTNKVHVRHQKDMGTRGVKTLHTLREEINESDVVCHVIGGDQGDMPPKEQVEELLRDLEDFDSRFPEIARLGLERKVPYTHWEAWLALYFGKRLCRFLVNDRFHPSTEGQPVNPSQRSQQDHAKRLEALKYYPKPVADENALFEEILHELITLGLLTQQEVRQPFNLPYSSIGTLFKGREEFLKQLRESLTQATAEATALVGKAVHGLGGVGKTRLAVEYAYQHRDEYSAVLFVTAETPSKLREDLAKLVGPLVLNLPEQGATEEELKMAATLTWLGTHPGWFLILDNVDSEESMQHVEDLLTKLHRGHVLITSRLAKWGDHVRPLELDVLPQEAATSLLLERTTPKGSRGRKTHPDDEKHASELAKQLDGLALALEQAAAYIISQRLSLTDYLKRWKTHDAEVQTWHKPGEIKYPRSVAATWFTTLDQLTPGEVALMNILAWFAPDPIPLFVLGLPCEFVGFNPEDEDHEEDAHKAAKIKEIWNEGVAALAAPNPPETRATSEEHPNQKSQTGPATLREALATLADFSMVRWNVEEETVIVHRVVQEILRTRQPEPTEWLTRALGLLDQARPKGNPADVRTWPQWEPLRMHVMFGTQEADRLNIAEPTSSLMGELGAMLWGKALHKEAEQLERRALAIDKQHFGQDSTQAATRLNNLAQTLQATNRLGDAEPLMRRALEIDEAAYGAEHPDVARDLNNLAQLLQATNRLGDAEPLMRRMVRIIQQFGQVTGHEHPNMQAALRNYGSVLTAMDCSQEEIEQRIEATKEIYGPLNPITPELEQLLGPATTVQAVLEALDQQYREQGRPTIWFLALNEPIAPHLDELLGLAGEETPEPNEQ